MSDTSHLSLADQHDYTNGGCAIFAIASNRLLGGNLMLLHCADPRQFEIQDWPEDEPLCLHAFVQQDDGSCIDAEGRRPLLDLLQSFGVERGWKYRLEIAGEEDVLAVFPLTQAGHDDIPAVIEMIREHGWDKEIPEADGSLTVMWEEAREASYTRHMATTTVPSP